ncbi:arginine deiminase type-3 [Aspergillus tamarii]|uniref:Arginine deiminase type-3 n=1 Tax=Aspergillus tamarii TaxID=41984 RepID=A0A5N6VCM7_ASPTM|nr:arginine deiminase type-3 [Aspergillus tamarii]
MGACLLLQFLFGCLSFSLLCLTFTVDIRADSNRDGKVDITGTSDLPDKLQWSNEAGAIFLANIGDTNRRCSQAASHIKPPPSNEELAACNDASDDIQRSPEYLAPLRTGPLPGLSTDAWGKVGVHHEIARKNVRIFKRNADGEGHVIVNNDYKFSQKELQDGLDLWIDARDTRRPYGWNGTAEVHFFVQNGTDGHSEDFVRLRVAPVLTHHHLQPAEELITASWNNPFSKDQYYFVQNLTNVINSTVGQKPLTLFPYSDDVWAQDLLEPGYTSMPGPNGPITLQIMIRSSQPSRVAGRQVFEYLRQKGRGAVYSSGGTRDEVNSMGNLETIPPYTHNGKSYPVGRVIEGRHETHLPHIYDYIRAQEIQDPLIIDADWLGNGHVDEFVQFLPANNPKSLHGWVLFIADPIGGLEILRKAKEEGHGDTPAFSRNNESWHPHPPSPYVPGYTINEFLSNETHIDENKRFAKLIDSVKETLKSETGIQDNDIHQVPVVFETGVCWGPDDGVSPERNCSSKYANALYPGPINGLVLNGYEYLAPDPWGPVIDGVDIMKEAISKAYQRNHYHVTYMDDWYSHHRDGGEIHCGTNSIRTVTRPWWNVKESGSKWLVHDEM